MARTLALFAVASAWASARGETISLAVDTHVTSDASGVITKDYSSFSIEFANFVDYVGNATHPNEFTSNLLENLANLTGAQPIIRVGGNTQDRTVFNSNQTAPIINVFPTPPGDQPTNVIIGPSFSSSYRALPDGVRVIPGLNFALNGTSGRQSLLAETENACLSVAIKNNLYLWEVGNEDDDAPGQFRPENWTIADYVDDWVDRSRAVRARIETVCPELAPSIGFFAPSFAKSPGSPGGFGADTAFKLGLNRDGVIKEISMHNYMSDASIPNTLQALLLNHTSIVEKIAPHLVLAEKLKAIAPGLPYVLGETNSVSGEGVNGLTNTFGDALWMVDFNLWTASQGIKRVHMHQGITGSGASYRYASWQPIAGNGTAPTTRPPYYGQVMVAKAIGHLSNNTRILNIPLALDTSSAYAIYDEETLSKVVLLNMQEFNATSQSSGSSPTSRPTLVFDLALDGDGQKAVQVERLVASGSDATGGITFAGTSYDFDLAFGRPVVVNQTAQEVQAVDGHFYVEVPASEAVLLVFQ